MHDMVWYDRRLIECGIAEVLLGMVFVRSMNGLGMAEVVLGMI